MVSFPDREIPTKRRDDATHELVGSGYDHGAYGHERQGRDLPKITQLSDDEIMVQRQPDGRLLISAQAANGYREWHFYRRCKD